MTEIISRPVARQNWQAANSLRNCKRAACATLSADSDDAHAVRHQADPWEKTIDEIAAMQHLGDNWDGLGAPAPSRELLESAVGLACLLQEAGTEVPSAVMQGLDGSVNFVWHGADGSYYELEIDRPLHADVVLLEPGKEPRHWELPNA